MLSGLLPWLIVLAQANLDACADIDIFRHNLECVSLLQQPDSMIDRKLLQNGPAQI